MADTPPGSRGGTRRTWIIVSVLLAIPIVVPLLVNTYAQEGPELFGFPFFYWYQFFMIVVASTLTFTAFVLSQKATAKDRKHRTAARRSPGDSPSDPPGEARSHRGGTKS